MSVGRILLMDDDPTDRELVIRQIGQELPDADIVDIRSKADFDRIMAGGEFDLVITDYQLRWTTGLDVLKRLKRERPLVPVIMFTASAGEEIAVDAMKSGLDDYVIKSTAHTFKLRNAIRAAAEHIARQEALSEAEIRYRDLFQDIPIGLYQTSPDGRFLEFNKALVDMLGFPSAKALLDTPTRSLYATDDDYNAWSDRMSRNGYVKELVVKMMRHDGEPIWVEINGKQVYRNGVLAYNEGSLQDVTDRILYQMEMKAHVQMEVQRALDREKQLMDLRNQFITMTSHEFRTPLASILTSSELLEHYGQNWSHEKMVGHLKRIQNSVKHIISMMDDVLFLGRSESGRLIVHKEYLDLGEAVAQILDEIRLNQKNSHPIAFDYQGGCADAFADRKLVRQIVTNLVMNAIKYSPAGSPVNVRLGCKGNVASMLIEDEGIGIPENEASQIFEPFFRAANVGDISGTGLGLAIVKRSVEAHNGTITALPRHPHGSSFAITLDIS